MQNAVDRKADSLQIVDVGDLAPLGPAPARQLGLDDPDGGVGSLDHIAVPDIHPDVAVHVDRQAHDVRHGADGAVVPAGHARLGGGAVHGVGAVVRHAGASGRSRGTA